MSQRYIKTEQEILNRIFNDSNDSLNVNVLNMNNVNTVDWGNILGNLSDQSDLSLELYSKINKQLIPITPGSGSLLTVNSDGIVTSYTHESLDNLSNILINEPELNDTLLYNGTKWINKPSNNGVSISNGIIFYFTVIDADITEYEKLLNIPDNNITHIDSVILNNNEILIDRYISDELNKLKIDAGNYIFNTYAKVDLIDNDTYIKYKLYLRNSIGTETLLFEVSTTNINNTNVLLYINQTIQQEFTTNLTDRLVIYVYGVTNNNVNTTISFYHSGTDYYSNLSVPLIYDHNELPNLQGGNTTERYHLTLTELNNVSNLSGVNTGDQDLSSFALKTTTINTYPLSSNITLNKSDIGLSFVDNTADFNKQVLSATKLTTARTINTVSFDGTSNITIYDSTKEPIINSGLTTDYYRGDKTWRNLNTDINTWWINEKTLTQTFSNIINFTSEINKTGAIIENGVISTTVAANIANWNPTGLSTCNVILVTQSGPNRNISGLVAQKVGTRILIINLSTSAANIVLQNENAGSTAPNRFSASGNITLAPGDTRYVWYNGTNSRWQII